MTSPIVFLKEVKSELTKVSWTTRQQAFRLTLIVIVISVIVAVFIGGLDLFFAKLMEVIIR
jgi:preprotein translocase subunit SecE